MILTYSVAGLARSGATRSGYPVLKGVQVPLYALSNVGRSGATRSNYVGARSFISVGGIQRGWGHRDGEGILAESLNLSDTMNATPTTLNFTARGWVPVEGQDIIITLGSINNPRRLFGGTVLSTRHRYVGDRPVLDNMLYDVQGIDYTWGLDRRKVSGDYKNASVAAIAASLLTFAPGYTLWVDPDIGAEILDEITFTEQALSNALSQLVKRVGGDYLCDYSKVVTLFYENSQLTPPSNVNAVHESMADLSWTRDLSQVITRCLGNFGGSNALDQIAPGATLLPVETAAWYLPGGGTVLSGQQRVTYGGLQVGGGGSLVGPGAAPTSAPNVALQPGAGVDVGTHDYAITYKTAAGESIPGPRITVPVGVFLPPTVAPTPGTPGPGATGPDPGVHDYAVSFVISTGETVPGPRVAVSTTLTPPPDTGPTPDAAAPGPGPDPGVHDYAVSFVTATGETTVGPIGGSVTTGPLAAPTTAPNPGSVTTGPGPDPGTYLYAVSFVRPEGETPIGPVSGPVTTGLVAPPPSAPYAASVTVGTGPTPGTHYYATTFVRSGGETTAGPTSSGVQTGVPGPPHSGPSGAPSVAQDGTGSYTYPGSGGVPGDWVSYAYTLTTTGQSDESAMGPASTAVQIIAAMGAGTVYPATNCCSRQIYIDPQGAFAKYYVSVNGGGWQWLGTTTSARWIQVAGSGTVGSYTGPGAGPTVGIVNLAGIPTSGDGTVTARRVYRDSGAGLKLLTTIGDNTTTTYTDTAATVSGAAPPGTNGTLAATVHLSGIQTAASGAGVIARKLYRWLPSAVWKFVATIADNTTTSYTDTTPNASLGPGPSGTNTTTGGNQTVHLSAIPRGSTAGGATGRRLYRRSGGAGLRVVATIADNTTTTYTDTTPNASLGGPPSINTALLRQIPLSALPIGNALVTGRVIYRTLANTGGGPLYLVTWIQDNTTTTFLDTVPDASLGRPAFTTGTAQAAQVQLTAIPLGAAAVTARVIYRTKAGLSQLQLVAVLNNNVITQYLDMQADATLGANAPTSDTSNLQQPTGNVLAGSLTLPCASVAAFLPTGGWAIVGGITVRYTGISGNALLGVPATGPGAITATITYNTTVVAAAMLTGIPTTGLGTIQYTILKGDPVNVFVQVDDLDAQAAVRAQLPGSDGIIEDELQDGRLSYTEGRARCQARLDLLGARDSTGQVGAISVTYRCRDTNTIAGATVSINLGPPINLLGDFLIQRVSVAQFHVPNLNPTYTVEASSLRFSAEEMLRLLRQGAL